MDEKAHKTEDELTTYKQHCEHLQKQIQSMMAENESTLKVNNALLYKTKILEEDNKLANEKIRNIQIFIESIEEEDIKQKIGEIINPESNKIIKSEVTDQQDNKEASNDPKPETEDVTNGDTEPKDDEELKSDTKEATGEGDQEIESTEVKPESSEKQYLQNMNDKKTISRLSNKIKELEILLEAENSDALMDSKNKSIQTLEKQVAELESQIEQKDQVVSQLQQSLADLQSKNQEHLEDSDNIKQLESRINVLNEELEQRRSQIESKDKLYDTYQKKITSLLEEKEDFLEKIEEGEKKEGELNDIVQQSKGDVSKKDLIYAKMLKMKERKVQKLESQIGKLQNADKSRQQIVEYFKTRIQKLEKFNKECERCKAYSKKKFYKENAPVDYDTELNGQSEKYSELMEIKKGINLSPRGGSVVNLKFGSVNDDDEEVQINPNVVEKLSLALAHSLKDPLVRNKKSGSKSAISDNEESVSMRDDFDSISDAYNDKLKRELELTMSDLRKLRTEYEEISHQNLTYKKTVSELQEKTGSLVEKVAKLQKLANENVIKEKTSEKQIKDLQKRRNAAKMEIMNLNSKIERMSLKAQNMPESVNHEAEPTEEQKDREEFEKAKEYKRGFEK